MLQIKVTDCKSHKYSGKQSHCGRSTELSPTSQPRQRKSPSLPPAKDLSPQDSGIPGELPPEPGPDVTQTKHPEQALTVPH